MSAAPVSSSAVTALAQRTAAAVAVLSPADAQAAETGPMAEVLRLADAARRADSTGAAWLVAVAMTGAMPDQALARAVSRALRLKEPEEFVAWLLTALLPLAARGGNAESTMRLVTDRPVVDVNFTAKSDFLTGIQRVVRGVVGRWSTQHDLELVVWSGRGGAFRALHGAERERLLERDARQYTPGNDALLGDGPEIVVPWGVPVVVIEVPDEMQSDRLAAVAELTSSSVRLVGHDCIPVSSAETVDMTEPEKFGRYLELVKHADRVAGVSQSAAAEFTGFARALSAQGLDGPTVTACSLPSSVPLAPTRDTSAETEVEDLPLVVCIGSVGRRKNQTALVEAAEVLWREGLDFTVRIFGHAGSDRTPLVGLAPELQKLGRRLFFEPGASDVRIASALSQARCLVFPSLHEGFGLPLVEALSQGVPVVASDFGSAREIAEGNGGLLVDPTDSAALVAALRSLLVDDDVHARLVAQARERPVRSWAEYADELWEVLL